MWTVSVLRPQNSLFVVPTIIVIRFAILPEYLKSNFVDSLASFSTKSLWRKVDVGEINYFSTYCDFRRYFETSVVVTKKTWHLVCPQVCPFIFLNRAATHSRSEL